MTDDILVYPTEKVVGIAPDRDTLSEVYRRLADADVDEEQVEVLAGGTAEDQLDPHAEGQNVVARAVRKVQMALGDEAVRLQTLNEAVADGKYVVQVALVAEDDDARENEKQSVGQALMTAGAHDVAFYGQWQIQELQMGA